MYCRLKLREFFLVMSFVVAAADAGAHSPHHVISEIAAAPRLNNETDAFILITDQILRSADRGASWKNLANGLNNRYEFTSIAMSPDYGTNERAYLATSGDGVYFSSDRGDRWQAFNSGLADLDILHISVASEADGSERVLLVAENGSVWIADAVAGNWRSAGVDDMRLSAMSVEGSTTDSDVVYGGGVSGTLWRSADSGNNWSVTGRLPVTGRITSIATRESNIFVGTESEGLWRSSDGGQTFARIDELVSLRVRDCRGNELEQPIVDNHITSVFMRGGDQRLYVTTWYNAIFVSDDLGASWRVWNEGLSCDQQADDMSVAHFRQLQMTTTNAGEVVFWLGAFDGLFVATDDDGLWRQTETLPLGLIKGLAVTGGTSDRLGIALATYGGGFYLTDDLGENWTIGNKGLQTTRLTGLSFSPDYADDGVIYAGASRRLLRSADRGASWQRVNLQPPGFAQRVRNKLVRWGMPAGWFGGSRSSTRQIYPTQIVQPPGARGERVLFATRFDGVMGYDRGREEIVSLWSGTDRIMLNLEMSTQFDTDRTLFASVRNEGVVRSIDGGNRWVPVNAELRFVQRWQNEAVDGDFRRDVVIEMSPNFANDQTLFIGSPAGDGLYKSTDAGQSWARLAIAADESVYPVLAIAASPNYAFDRTLLVSIKGHGLYRSTDGGSSFDSINSTLARVNASIEWLGYSADYASDDIAIAASDEVLFVTEDGGNHWTGVRRPVRYENMRDVILYSGEWELHSDDSLSAMSDSRTSTAGSRARVHFVGGGVRLIGSCQGDAVRASIRIDGIEASIIDCAGSGSAATRELYSTGLPYGPHLIDVVALAGEGGSMSGQLAIDAFDILPGPQ